MKNKMKPQAETRAGKALPGQVFLVMTGFLCNNDCLMCSVKPKGANYKPRGTREIIADMARGRAAGYERVEFTGGEPALRKDLPLLAGAARKMGYAEIAVSTNSRAFHSENFLKSMAARGLNRVTTTLYSSEERIHDSITRSAGSFSQTVRGIKNCLSLGLTTSVNTVLFSLTAAGLAGTAEFLSALGVRYWTLLDLIPDGFALAEYERLSLGPAPLKAAFLSIKPALKKFASVNIFDFPFCLVPRELFDRGGCNILAARGRTEIINQVGYAPRRFERKDGLYFDIHKTRAAKCGLCARNGDCGGLWTPYEELYGTSFLKPFAGKRSAGPSAGPRGKNAKRDS